MIAHSFDSAFRYTVLEQPSTSILDLHMLSATTSASVESTGVSTDIIQGPDPPVMLTEVAREKDLSIPDFPIRVQSNITATNNVATTSTIELNWGYQTQVLSCRGYLFL
ncbi:unnamed protein product [Protopolystoma xenopodis]|uniref:Uncharacterized protein n=1 Tax=Protopolystoma xenopodis TaxID=117903 RepID=A0A448XQW5_9PLAT|nr:unnamed protein product [Protopolystoma xenopodis]